MLNDDFYKNLDVLLKKAADEDEEDTEEDTEEAPDEEFDLGELGEADPEEDVIEGLESAKDEAPKDEALPPLGEGDDLLDAGSEEAFEPALTPSKWEVASSGDGYITFTKTDSESDPEATKGRYQKNLRMDTGKPDDAIIDYINTFLVQNKLDTNPKKHLTERTPYGPKSTDEFDNDVSVVREWKNGKHCVSIRWKAKDESIQVPPQFKKEVKIPDELSPKVPEELPAEEPVEDIIPSLDDLETGEEIGEEGAEEETGEEIGEEPAETEEEVEEEPEEETASLVPRILRISDRIRNKTKDSSVLKIARQISAMAYLLKSAADDEFELPDLGEEEDTADDAGDAADFDLPDLGESEETSDTDEEVPVSADITEIVNSILGETREEGKTIFQDYIEGEALKTGVLFPRDFKDLSNFRKEADSTKLRDKEKAMAERIYGDIDRILKAEASTEEIKNKLSSISKGELLDIIADNIEQISSQDTSGKLGSPVKPLDIAEVPEDETLDQPPDEVQEDPQEETSPVEKLVEVFYQMRGSLSPVQKRNISDMELLEKAREKLDEDQPDEAIEDTDFDKAKQLISRDLESRGDLVGNP